MLPSNQTKTTIDKYVSVIKTKIIYYIDNKNNGNIIKIIQQVDCQETLEAVKKKILKNHSLRVMTHTFRVVLRDSKRKDHILCFVNTLHVRQSLYFNARARL